jgi:predicted nuclease of predicted toxin-antitoxin system
MTQFLIDENIPPAVADFLRTKGFDVKEVKEAGIHGLSDAEIMDLARQGERVLVTFDKHFSNILLYPLDSHYGVIRIRIHPPLVPDILRVLDQFLQKFDLSTIRRTLIVLEREGFRVRRIS